MERPVIRLDVGQTSKYHECPAKLAPMDIFCSLKLGQFCNQDIATIILRVDTKSDENP
jgi:hypothetical protein